MSLKPWCVCLGALLAPATSGRAAPDLWGVSAAFGYLRSETDVALETDKKGMMGGGKALLIWQQDAHRYDVGLGFNVNTAKGETDKRRQAITQIGALLDFTYAYRLWELVDLGATVHTESGKGSHLDLGGEDRFRVWGGVGPTARLRLDLTSLQVEVGASALMDVTVPKRTQVKTPLFASMLFPIGGSPKRADIASPAPAPVPVPVPAPAPAPAPVPPTLPAGDLPAGHVAQLSSDNELKIILPPSRVSFATGKATVSAEGAAYLERLGTIFRKLDSSLLSIEVAGHTDRRGSAALNDRLSKERADAVRAALVKGGASPGKIKARGAGSSEPRDKGDTEDAFAANRRVEVGVKVSDLAREMLVEINNVDKEFKR